MDIPKKKQEVLEDIARQPANVVFARISICDTIQLSELLKEEFVPYLRGPANSSSGTNATDSLHEVCVNLAHQRALLQGAAAATNPATGILAFNINDGTTTTRANGTAAHNTTSDLTFPKFEDASYSNKTTLPYTVLHDLNEDGGVVTLSSTSNANTTITNDEGTDVKYFTDFSKYFLTRSRANGEIVSIDENTSPYTTPTTAEPFFPANTINGETFRGTAKDPTANSDTRHEFSLTANTTGTGYAGANNDITENKWVGNTYVIIKLSNAAGTFSESESLTDFDNNSATIKTQANTTTVVLESGDIKGTFESGEIISDGFTNATISSIETANTSASITLTGNTFITGSNADVTLGFSKANTISVDDGSISRTGSVVTIIANNHGINSGDRVVLKGADDAFSEFNDTFIVSDASEDTLQFETANSVTVVPTGSFSLVKNVFFGRTSNASGAVTIRTANASAELRFQSSNLSVGFPVGNTVTGQSSTASGYIEERTIKGDWYQTKTNEVKTYYAASDSGTWDYDSTNNANGIETTANTGEFWLKNFEMVKINQLVASSGTGDEFVAPKIVLDIALATSTDTSGGYDSTKRTQMPGTYFAYPLKTYEDQVHDGTTTIEAYSNFANVVISPEGLEINFDWKPLANTSGVATNSTHLYANGDSVSSDYTPEKATVLNKSDFNGHLGPFNSIPSGDDIYLSANSDNRSSGKNTGNTSGGIDGDVYRSANANPFFPAIAGTQKPISDTENDITGTQPGSLTANDVYAGTHTEIQKGALDPGAESGTAGARDYRYIIQNDLKWCYATSPFAAPVGAATSTGEGQSAFTPRNAAFTAAYDGYSKSSTGYGALIDSIEAQSATSHTHDNTIPADSKPSGTGYGGGAWPSSPPSLTSVTINSTSYNKYVGTQPTATGTFAWVASTASGTGASKKVTSTTTSDVIINTTDSGTGAVTKTVTRSTSSHQNYTYNAIQDVLNNANTTTFMTMVTSLWHSSADSTYGAAYEDPNEPSSPNLKTDATFESDVDTIKGLHNNVTSYHDGVIDGTSNGYTNGAAHTYANTDYAAFITGIGTFQTAMKLRITEISNRIGYLNGKGSQSGGIADGGSGTQSSNSGTAGHGFAGTDFNGGKGYANTIYAHCNFLAGKKLKLIQKVLTSIADVQALYDAIKAKRSEYYEYNQ
tara:strand:+ start:4197 stop:7706 length:3510 start_codon:yes stop_codon:yes gene_type:complete